MRRWRAFARKWGEDHVLRLSAATSFYAALSLAPLLVVAVAWMTRLFGEGTDAKTRLFENVRATAGEHVEAYLRDMLNRSSHPPTTVAATLLSLLITVGSASGLFLQVNDSIHHIWGARYDRHWLRAIVISRIWSMLSLAMFGACVVLWLATESWMGALAPEEMDVRVLNGLAGLFALAFFTVAFALVYRTIPARAAKWKDVWWGAIVASVGLGISRFVLRPYLHAMKVSVAYGAAGALMVALMWFYYVAIVFYTGAIVVFLTSHRDRIQDDGSIVSEPEV